MPGQPPITDSPWLWFALFSGVGLVALVATGGKFGDRQAQIERKGQAHEAVVGGIDVQEEASGKLTVENPPDYSRPGHIHIHLGPLVAVIGAVCAGSLVMLARERRLAARNTDS
jgi:hypothetical protein